MSKTRIVDRRKLTTYVSDSVAQFLGEQANRLGVSINWIVSWSVLRNRAGIEAIPSADDLLWALQEWPSTVRATQAPQYELKPTTKLR